MSSSTCDISCRSSFCLPARFRCAARTLPRHSFKDATDAAERLVARTKSNEMSSAIIITFKVLPAAGRRGIAGGGWLVQVAGRFCCATSLSSHFGCARQRAIEYVRQEVHYVRHEVFAAAGARGRSNQIGDHVHEGGQSVLHFHVGVFFPVPVYAPLKLAAELGYDLGVDFNFAHDGLHP